jgi:hypothetical protein
MPLWVMASEVFISSKKILAKVLSLTHIYMADGNAKIKVKA